MARMTGARQSPTLTPKARTRASAGAGLLLLGTLLTGCGAEPGEIPLSEIQADTPSASPETTPATASPGAAGSAAATPGLVGAASGAPAATADNGPIVGVSFLDATRTTSSIVAIAPDGADRRQITQPPNHTSDDRPDWSPDGSTIAFDRTDVQSGAARLWTVSASGDGAHQIGQLCEASAADCANEDERAPAYSPDGKQLAFSRSWGALDRTRSNQVQYSDLYLMNPDGTEVQRLTFLTNDKPYSGQVSNPSWSPDGKQLTFEYRTSATGQPANSRAIYVVGADGTGLRQLTPWELRAGDRANWSPDGTQILFTTYPAGPDNAPGGGIYTVHPDGTAIGALTPAPSDAFYGTASFAPDGKSIVFASAAAGAGADLYSMQPDGTGVTRLTNGADAWLSRQAWGKAAAPVQPQPAAQEPAQPQAQPQPQPQPQEEQQLQDG
ncbi:TolB protein [Kitasatospora sp. MAA19]|uniref:hypothetical protein n=1 Tax=Kitasatospora sp. MAA19 TaxID=3035090 RepID=UPI00247600C4|nr:hypothetical protein [Kitasatospora sp. MAA19]MDH6711475.1 TolB protein [Kitasatospora sp. MAA19]